MKSEVEVTEFTEFISNLGIKKIQGASKYLLCNLIIADVSSRMVESQNAALTVGLSTVGRKSCMYGTVIWVHLLYRLTFGVTTAVASIRPVVNRILPYFDSCIWPSYGSQYLM